MATEGQPVRPRREDFVTIGGFQADRYSRALEQYVDDLERLVQRLEEGR
jgi:hypothetical protein